MLDDVKLRLVSDLQGFGLIATDGGTGAVEHFYFDDEQWEAEGCPGLEDVAASLQWMAGMDWKNRTVGSHHSDDAVRLGLKAENSEPISSEYEMPRHRTDGQTGYLLN